MLCFPCFASACSGLWSTSRACYDSYDVQHVPHDPSNIHEPLQHPPGASTASSLLQPSPLHSNFFKRVQQSSHRQDDFQQRHHIKGHVTNDALDFRRRPNASSTTSTLRCRRRAAAAATAASKTQHTGGQLPRYSLFTIIYESNIPLDSTSSSTPPPSTSRWSFPPMQPQFTQQLRTPEK